MAVATEIISLPTASAERYGFSMKSFAELGRLSLLGANELAIRDLKTEVLQDFRTAVAENIVTSRQAKNDEQTQTIRERLRFEPLRSMPIIEGKVCDQTGRPITEMIADGVAKAQAQAAIDPRWDSEVERAQNDLKNANEVETLRPGELLAVVSMEPLEAMERDGEAYWRDCSIIGYQRGLAVIQVYYRPDKNTMLAGAYSVRGSDKAAFKQLLKNWQVEMDVSLPANQWILHGIRRHNITPHDATAFGPRLNQQYRQIIGVTTPEISVTQLMADHDHILQAYFENYMMALSHASHSQLNNEIMQGLARTMMNQADLFEAQDQQVLSRIANSMFFLPGDDTFMEKVVRYACAEEFWRLLLPPSGDETSGDSAHFRFDPHDFHALHRRLASNIRQGLSVGRSGGGCAAATFKSPNEATSSNETEQLGRQNIFGGSLEAESDEGGACEYDLKFCYCCPFDSDGNRLPDPITVRARREEDGTAHCLRSECGAVLGANGKPLSKGGIYKKALAKGYA